MATLDPLSTNTVLTLFLPPMTDHSSLIIQTTAPAALANGSTPNPVLHTGFEQNPRLNSFNLPTFVTSGSGHQSNSSRFAFNRLSRSNIEVVVSSSHSSLPRNTVAQEVTQSVVQELPASESAVTTSAEKVPSLVTPAAALIASAPSSTQPLPTSSSVGTRLTALRNDPSSSSVVPFIVLTPINSVSHLVDLINKRIFLKDLTDQLPSLFNPLSPLLERNFHTIWFRQVCYQLTVFTLGLENEMYRLENPYPCISCYEDDIRRLNNEFQWTNSEIRRVTDARNRQSD